MSDNLQDSRPTTCHPPHVTATAHNAPLTGYYKFEANNADAFLAIEALAKTFGFKRIPSWRIKKPKALSLEPEVTLPSVARLKIARSKLFRAIGRKALGAIHHPSSTNDQRSTSTAPIVTHPHYEQRKLRRNK